MAETAWADVAAAVVAALDTALSVPVFDGPPNTGDSLESFVCVGASPEDSDGIASPDAGGFEQDYRTLGGSAPRDERGRITGYIYSWTGDTTLTTARTAAFALFATVSDTLRDTPTLGLTAVRAPEVEIASSQVQQGYTAQGCRCVITFTLAYTAMV